MSDKINYLKYVESKLSKQKIQEIQQVISMPWALKHILDSGVGNSLWRTLIDVTHHPYFMIMHAILHYKKLKCHKREKSQISNPD